MGNFDANQNKAKSGGWQGKGGSNGKLTLSDDYLRDLEGGYYSDSQKLKLKKEYIVKYPKDIANKLEEQGRNDANKRSQIRKFYEYLLRVENKMNLPKNDFSSIEADFMGLVPHVTYARQRSVITDIFVQFIEKNAAAVHDEKDLRAFVKHFEAVIAFTKKN